MNRSWLVIIISLVFSSARAQEVTDDLLAEFEKSFQAAMQTYNVPGSAVAIVQDGDIIYAKGFGVRNLETGEPITTSTVFRVGSTTKAMTSLMIATLVDEGVLDWDTPAVEIYPDFKLPSDELTQSVTLRELMGMGTGLGSNIPTPHWDEYSASDLLAALATLPVLGKKGETYFYNNPVYSSAGYVAALATKPGEQDLFEVYKTLMQERVFDPIGMDTAVLSDDPASVSDDYAASYTFSLAKGPEANELVPYAAIHTVGPAGSVVTNVMDMARFVITQLNEGVNPEGKRVVSAENLKETWKPQTKSGEILPGQSEELTYGMGWVNEQYDDITFLWHNGGWDGFTSEMALLPDAKAGIVILSNSSLGQGFNMIMRYNFIELLYGKEPKLSEQLPVFLQGQIDELRKNADMFSTSTVEAEDVQAYLGNYEHGWRLEHRDDDGTLWLLRPGWELQLLPTPDGFVISSGVALGGQISFGEGEKPSLLINLQGETQELARQ